ncbi:Uncharacterised protein [Klebsiella pneumoniae]|uniref:Uncharacterized protein n=1 Tax=Klebsiella pneumoniae TaxID=573 RepID=A0A2X3II63_KLEPN|nr:Uncharacterised protein [Klebsiella pneumoniae]
MEKHSLLYGVKVGDKVHFDFQVRMPVVRDTIEALSLTYEKYGTTEGAVAATYYRHRSSCTGYYCTRRFNRR